MQRRSACSESWHVDARHCATVHRDEEEADSIELMGGVRDEMEKMDNDLTFVMEDDGIFDVVQTPSGQRKSAKSKKCAIATTAATGMHNAASAVHAAEAAVVST